jgi:uncharacterized protein (DUF305 family)
MKKEAIAYGVIGLLIGVLAAGLFSSYAVNNNHSGMLGMMGVNGNRVMDGDIDKRFIEQMIPHHDSAIAMAKLAQQKASHEEIKTLAKNIISSQTAENKQMRQWYKDWYNTDVPEAADGHMGHVMMVDSQAGIDGLTNAADFDKAFLQEMIPHHQMAVMMANMLSASSNRADMQQLADNIIAAQTKEINEMKSWQRQWGYENSSGGNMMEMMH